MTQRKESNILTHSLQYEVLQATTMLLYLLSSAACHRHKQQTPHGGAYCISLPGLPGLCFSPCIIKAPDEYLYGPQGAASQLVYKGWVQEVFGLWENRFRNELAEMYSRGSKPFRPQMDAFGDLRHIRNDLFHSGRGVATSDHTGKCKMLHWFSPGEDIILGLKHVFDFLNQAGFLLLTRDHRGTGPWKFYGPFNSAGYSFQYNIWHSQDKLINWQPKPRLVSVRTHQDNPGPTRFKGITVVFNNGLIGQIPIGPLDAARQTQLGEGRIDPHGNLRFRDGTVFDSWSLYLDTVRGWCEPWSEGDGPDDPVAGPWMRIRPDSV